MAQGEARAYADLPYMVQVVGVRFRQAGKIYYFDPGDHSYRPGDRVVVETGEGREVGEVAIRPKLVPADTVVLPLRPVLRMVSEEDTGQLMRHRDVERSALDVALERAEAHGLDMKFVSAESAFEGNRLRFFFVSETRVDFRQLVRDLANRLQARIELRQIGVRDQAKMVGGIGDCGRELCCTTWMGDFEPVSIRMAKLQSLSLNPSRLSGQCGRLKCCLKFEYDMYRELVKKLPKIGSMVMTEKGRGKVVELMAIKESVLVDLGDGRRVVVHVSDLLGPEEGATGRDGSAKEGALSAVDAPAPSPADGAASSAMVAPTTDTAAAPQGFPAPASQASQAAASQGSPAPSSQASQASATAEAAAGSKAAPTAPPGERRRSSSRRRRRRPRRDPAAQGQNAGRGGSPKGASAKGGSPKGESPKGASSKGGSPQGASTKGGSPKGALQASSPGAARAESAATGATGSKGASGRKEPDATGTSRRRPKKDAERK